MSPVCVIGIKGYKVIEMQSKAKVSQVHVEPEQAPRACPYCGGGRLRSKGRYKRRARHLRHFGQESELIIHCRRYRCVGCSKTFVPPLPGIRPWRHSTEPFRDQVYRDHHDGICGRCVAQRHRIGSATVERVYQERTIRKAKERMSLQCPQMLGIDEHTLHKGYRFATTFCDLKNHRVFDVMEGRSEKDLEAFLSRLKGREQVQLVCIDLSSPYRHLIRKWFPRARIVADRFHVIRVVLYHIMKLCRQIVPDLAYQRGWNNVLRKHAGNLTANQQIRLRRLFERFPALQGVHEFKEKLCTLLNIKTQTQRDCRRHIAQLGEYLAELGNSNLSQMQTLAQTLTSWQEEIACMWRFAKNNGITEGFHRKMKLIQRRAYGFRNFNNYRLRVIAQCG
jgi:transposase